MATFSMLGLVACAAATLSSAEISFRGSAQMRQEDVTEVLGAELASHSERLVRLEEDLSQMYAGLPKNADGKVSHQGVRYVLHRYFMNTRGWFIRGLEPGGAGWTPQRNANGELPPAFVKEWVPTFLQNQLEERVGSAGVALHELAALAASLEDLIHKEVRQRLEMVFDVLHVPKTGDIDRVKADEVLMTYFMAFLMGNNITARDQREIELKRARFTKKYAGFAEAKTWYEATVQEKIGNGTSPVSFDSVAAAVEEIGATYHKFNDLECNDLRSTLRKMESRRAGRVRLSTFYNMSRFTHWRFVENTEYLRSLGALDKSDTKQSSVVVANYVMGRQNCLEATNLYAICCKNACEDLMGHLEEQIAASKAPASTIAALVAALPSDSVAAPRTLSPLLLGRLDEIAAHHGGEVPLHGRLFSQWMHHAFPMECPFPHELGSINPQTVDEWLRDSGSATEQTSSEERQAVVEGDVCAIDWEGKVECADEETELPWNTAEELFTGDAAPFEEEDSAAGRLLCIVAFLAMGVAFLVAAAQQSAGRSACSLELPAFEARSKPLVVSMVLLLTTVAFVTGLINGFAFALALCSSIVFLVAARRSAQVNGKGALLPKHMKMCA